LLEAVAVPLEEAAQEACCFILASLYLSLLIPAQSVEAVQGSAVMLDKPQMVLQAHSRL
jgi:hypothetical protein